MSRCGGRKRRRCWVRLQGGRIPFKAAQYGLNALASGLNPVAVVTMKAAMKAAIEYPLKFGADL